MSKLIKVGKSIFNSENIKAIRPNMWFNSYTIEVYLNNNEEKIENFDTKDDRDEEMQRLYKIIGDK